VPPAPERRGRGECARLLLKGRPPAPARSVAFSGDRDMRSLGWALIRVGAVWVCGALFLMAVPIEGFSLGFLGEMLFAVLGVGLLISGLLSLIYAKISGEDRKQLAKDRKIYAEQY
jgi:hypothetical protein